jgi:hypothetical protein
VNENLVATLGRNKTKALGVVEPLDCPVQSHATTPSTASNELEASVFQVRTQFYLEKGTHPLGHRQFHLAILFSRAPAVSVNVDARRTPTA